MYLYSFITLFRSGYWNWSLTSSLVVIMVASVISPTSPYPTSILILQPSLIRLLSSSGVDPIEIAFCFSLPSLLLLLAPFCNSVLVIAFSILESKEVDIIGSTGISLCINQLMTFVVFSLRLFFFLGRICKRQICPLLQLVTL